MPREFSDDYERGRRSEYDETEEHIEVDEKEKSAKEIIREVTEELEPVEQAESVIREVINELEEIEAREQEDAKKIVEDTVRELQELEEDLGYTIEEAREELHDEFVNDMESKLDGPSLKDSRSESNEVKEDGESEEEHASGESYIEGSDGTVYVMETGGSFPAEVSSENEMEEHAEGEPAEGPENKEETPEEQEVRASSEFRNSIIKSDTPEDIEDDEVESSAPERREISPTDEIDDRHYPAESDSEESKKECREQESVIEHEDVKESAEDENDEMVEVGETENLHEFQKNEQELQEHEVDEIQKVEVVAESKDEELEVTEDLDELVDCGSEVEECDDALEDSQHEVSDCEGAFSEVDVQELPDDVPEELIQKIEELLDELESLEDEEVDESRVIVEAMTGKKHIDRSLEPRPYFSETEEDIEQRERERVREKVAALFGKLSESERKRLKERVRARLGNEDDLDAWLKVHSSLKASPDFKQHYEEAKKYLRGKRVGGTPRLISELLKAEVERVWTQLVGTVVQRRVLGLPMGRSASKEASKEWTQERLDELLSKYKHLTKHMKFKVRYRNAVSWIVLMKRLCDGEVQAEPPIEVLKELSKEFLTSTPTICIWLKRKSKPMLVVQLERLLGVRPTPGGWQLPLVVSESTLNQVSIDQFRPILRSEQILNDQLLELLNGIINSLKHSVWFTEFPSEFAEILSYLKENKGQLENVLSSSAYRISLAIYSNRLFVYRKKHDEFSWTQLLEDELFYLNRGWKRGILGDVLGMMKLRNLKELSYVIRELTGYGEGVSIPVGGINADLQSRPNHLTGRTLGFVLDVTDSGISQVKNRISAIGKSYGKNWQIRNPRFPEGLELQEILARLYAIIASDGHIDKQSFSLTYCENNPERKLRIRSILAALGDVWINEYFDPERADTLSFPPVLGRLMYKFGIPVGDKVIQSVRIPSFIMNGPPEVQSAYLQELIPEEGAVTYSVYGGLKILWGRSVVLHEQRAAKNYAGQRNLDRNLIEFIINHGKYEKKRDCYRVSAGHLRSLKKSKDLIVARTADELEKIVRSHKNRLQLDEQQLCSNLGIKTGRHLCYVRYYVRSGRVSAHWEAHTRSKKDVEMWWKQAPPNDVRKRGRLECYFSNQDKDD